MKKIVFLLLVGVMLCASSVYATDITFGIDPNGSTPEGYLIFQREDGAPYVYTSFIWQGSENEVTVTLAPVSFEGVIPKPTDLNGGYVKETGDIILGWNQTAPEPVEKTFYFVARAYLDDQQSEDSNEVSQVVSINDTIDHWTVYYGDNSDGPWTEFTTVTGTNTVTEPFPVVPEGEMRTVYFTIVAFGESGAYSANADAFAITIDRRTLEPPTIRIITPTN